MCSRRKGDAMETRKEEGRRRTGRAASIIAGAAVVAGLLPLLGGCAGPIGTVRQEQTSALSRERNPVGTVGAENSSEGKQSMEASKPAEVSYKAEDFDEWKKLLEENQTSDSFREALGRFAFQSGSRVLTAEKGNVNYSPLSLYYALALAGCGAEGETASQIADNLGVRDQSQLAEECRKLYQWFYYYSQREKVRMEQYGEGSDNSDVRLANSLWISEQLNIKKDYQKLAASSFFASSYQVDFTAQEAGKQMGKWIGEQTKGVLNPELKMNPSTRLAILNTLYFYGSWQDKFAAEETAEDNFTKEDGGKVTCPFMNRVERSGDFKKGDGYTVSVLDTTNACRMVLLLPDEGRSVEEFLNAPEKLESALESKQENWQKGEVTWKVPKFSFGASLKLNELLKNMGMENMFDSQKADFGAISDRPLFVDTVIQESHIGIDEEGVEGAAFTMIAFTEGSAMVDPQQKADMILDRPFIYGIQDGSTGAWLFLGVCRNPVSEE